jgi:hypothetical protein
MRALPYLFASFCTEILRPGEDLPPAGMHCLDSSSSEGIAAERAMPLKEGSESEDEELHF